MSAANVGKELEQNIPRKFWPEFNELVVGFGQVRCFA